MSAPPEVPRISFYDFLNGLPPADRLKCWHILKLNDSRLQDYHDSKGMPGMTLQDHARELNLTLEETEAANQAIHALELPVAALHAQGFLIPEVSPESSTLTWRFDFPTKSLLYLDRQKVFLDDSGPPTVYVW